MAKDDKRIERLEKAVEKAEKKQRKLKKRVEELEEVLSDLQEADDTSPAPVGSEPAADEAGDEAADDAADETATGRPELSEPDESWTVARLREAALSRGLTGISRMTKAELLAAVSEAGHRG